MTTSSPIAALGGRLRALSIGARLILSGTLLTLATVGLTFWALSLEIRGQTRRLLTGMLEQHQRTILAVQRRDREDLLWASRLMTESPTLRAAMETYGAERFTRGEMRADLLATIQVETDRIAGGLARSVLVVTDADGRVLAGRVRGGPPIPPGADLSREPVVARALTAPATSSPGGFGVLTLVGRAFEAGGVPIVLQGYTIGALILGEPLDAAHVEGLRDSFRDEVVITLGPRVLASTLPAAVAEPFDRIDGEEYVTAALPLGVDARGEPATLHLLHSLTGALGPVGHSLAAAFLIYGALAMAAAAVAAWLVARSVLRPLRRFVAFLRQVAERSDRTLRFAADGAGPEVLVLSETFGRLMESLAGHERRLVERAREDLERVERLKESEKLAAVGRMLSGAAHEINNPLTGVIGNIDILLAQRGLEPAVRGRLEIVRREGRRIVGLVRNLLKTVHRDDGRRDLVDLNAVLRECIDLRRHEFAAAGIDLRLDAGAGPCCAWVNELEMQQVFLNIIHNGHDALRGRTDMPELRIRTSVSEDGVAVVFEDNGPGLRDPEKVFDHFYTTKEIGQGTGLGLSIARAIVQHHGGRIAAENHPAGGARFAITLPSPSSPRRAEPGAARVPEKAPTTIASSSSAAPPAGAPDRTLAGVEVLVVDDEPSVLELQMAILETAGASVTSARSGSEAVGALEKRSFELVITDVRMPGRVSGPDLYEWALAHRPETAPRFVFVTGDVLGDGTRVFLERTGRRSVQKPFTIPDYLRTLHDTLATRRAA